MTSLSDTFDFSSDPLAVPRYVVKDAGRFALGAPTQLPDPREELRALLAVPESHVILVMKGDRQLHYAMVALNFLRESASANYIVTGRESARALESARAIGNAHEVVTAEKGAAYVHFTGNDAETGTQTHGPPDPVGAPLICDMSEDLFCRRTRLNAWRFALIYADVGPASIVIAEKRFIHEAGSHLPPGLRYATYDGAPPPVPVLSIFLAWLRLGRNVSGDTAPRNLYRAIDRFPNFYRCSAPLGRRSSVTGVFQLPSPELQEVFLLEAERAGFFGLRADHGIRVWMHAAVRGMIELHDFMTAFARQHRTGTLPEELRGRILALWPDADVADLPRFDRLSVCERGSLAWLEGVKPDGTRYALRWKGDAWRAIQGLSDLQEMLREAPCEVESMIAAYIRFAGAAEKDSSPLPEQRDGRLSFFAISYGVRERVTIDLKRFAICSEPVVPIDMEDSIRLPLPAPYAPGTFLRYRGGTRSQPYAVPGNRYRVVRTSPGRRGTGALVPDPARAHLDWGLPDTIVDATEDGSSVIRLEPLPRSALDFDQTERLIRIHWQDRLDWEPVE